MNGARISLTGLLTIITLILTIGFQVYKNVQNYNYNKNQFRNDLQLWLDKSVEAYLTDLAKENVITYSKLEKDSVTIHLDKANIKPYTVFKRDTVKGKSVLPSGSIRLPTGPIPLPNKHTEENRDKNTHILIPPKRSQHITIRTSKDDPFGVPEDSMVFSPKTGDLISRIFLTVSTDTIDFEKFNNYLKKELERQNTQLSYALIHSQRDKQTKAFNAENIENLPNTINANTAFLPLSHKLEMYYGNPALHILKRGMVDLLLSVFFLLIISIAMAYLYQTIKSQKALALVKNDLINNITHEFKTPIATINSALEAMQSFNPNNDEELNQKYLGISRNQLKKLNAMVEKLLETATLNSEHLVLQKEQINLYELVGNLVDRFKQTTNKEIEFKFSYSNILTRADHFHLENAIANIVDNAIKYGGNKICIHLARNGEKTILISDNGGNIPPSQKDKIFDQFYRIPTGNIHDVKGFGIGLYYTKKIIEKHGGKISLDISNHQTTFKIQLP